MEKLKKVLKNIFVVSLAFSLLFCNVQAAENDLEVSNLSMGATDTSSVISEPILPKLDTSKIADEILKASEAANLNVTYEKDNTPEMNSSNKLMGAIAATATTYTPFINFEDKIYPNMPRTPGNQSISAVFQKIKENNPSNYYSPSLSAIDSAYIVSTTISGVTQHFYVMEIVYHTSFYLEDHGLIVYNQNYKSHPLYNTGYYEKGFSGICYGNPGASNYILSFRAGTISAYVPYQAYSFTEFGEYRRFYLHDFFKPSISLQIGGYDPDARFPYFVSWVTAGNRIIYGRANWYLDGSGSNNLRRIDRITGNTISNDTLPFISNNQFENGFLSTYDIYSYTSTVKTTLSYTIDLNTLQVLSTQIPVTGVTLNKSSITLNPGQSETLVATVYPSNATNKYVTWASSNTSVATVDATGKVTAVSAGTATITVRTQDGGYTRSCTVTVNSTNRPPVLGYIGGKVINEGQLLKFSINASDPDGNVLTYTAYNLPNGAVFDPATKTFSWTPDYTQAGTYTVRFEVSDGSLKDSEDITITVNNVNRPPVLNLIGDKSVDEAQPLEFSLSATDPDGDPIEYIATGLPQGAVFDPATKTFSWTPDYTQAGTYTVHFEVSDGTLADSEDITITVNNVNRPPVLDSIGEKAVDEVQLLELTLNAADPDGDPLEYIATNLPQGGVFDPVTRTFSWTPDYTQAGTYTVHFEVSDGTLADSEDITITVNNVNRPPVLAAIGNKSVDEGQQLTFTLDAVDPDGDPLVFIATNLPQGASFDPATKTFSWTPDYTQAGTYSVHFEVSDGNLSTSEDITITVNNVSSDQLTTDFIEFIENLDLPNGTENSLTNTLTNAIKSIESGNPGAGVNQLEAFINKVEAMSGKKLTSAQADALIKNAQKIIFVAGLEN